MTVYPEAEVRSAAERLIEHHSKASEVTDWTFFVDETYTEDAEYICEYAGVRPVTAIGRKQIKETHYGEDMGGFEDWTFPYDGYAVNGNRIITHWWNRGPGKRPDGSFYQTPGVSFITYAGNGMFSHQHDFFDLAHQMKLCDELEEAGLLNARLKEVWVKPKKAKLVEMLTSNMD